MKEVQYHVKIVLLVDTSDTYGSNNADGTCTVCAVGQYQDKEGQQSCNVCSKGEYQDETAQTSCKASPSGALCTSDRYETRLYRVRRVLPGRNHANSCKASPVGSHTPESGMAAPIPCPVGTKGVSEGMSLCEKCPTLANTKTRQIKVHVNCVPRVSIKMSRVKGIV